MSIFPTLPLTPPPAAGSSASLRSHNHHHVDATSPAYEANRSIDPSSAVQYSVGPSAASRKRFEGTSEAESDEVSSLTVQDYFQQEHVTHPTSFPLPPDEESYQGSNFGGNNNNNKNVSDLSQSVTPQKVLTGAGAESFDLPSDVQETLARRDFFLLD